MLISQWTWAKPDTVKTENDYVFYDNLWEPYNPFDYPNMPNQLAKVDSKEKVVSFVKKYGLLGYQALVSEEESTDIYTVGDPVDWFIQHGKTVKFALYLINAVHDGHDDEYIKSLILKQQVKVPMKMFIDTTEEDCMDAHCFAEGASIAFRPILYPDQWEERYALLAIQIVSHLVNVNTSGVQQKLGLLEKKLAPAKPYQFAQQIHPRSLIEGIWYQIGTIALDPQGKGTRVCKECSLPFIVTDKRQEFCPSDGFSRGSLCGSRHRIRDHRENKKKGR